MKANRIAALAIGAMAGIGMASTPTTPQLPKGLLFQAVRPTRNEKRIRGGGISVSRNKRGAGPGWTFAHVKRMAKKRRNVIRNRRNQR